VSPSIYLDRTATAARRLASEQNVPQRFGLVLAASVRMRLSIQETREKKLKKRSRQDSNEKPLEPLRQVRFLTGVRAGLFLFPTDE
jgi:hypothetical protein